MRKFILVAAMVLVSATAQAGASRGLTVAQSDTPAAVEQPKAVEAPSHAETPKYTARPAAVDTTPEAPRDRVRPRFERDPQMYRAERPRYRRVSIRARIRYALHRYGIYW
jgi:hypothetical protein